MNGQEGGVISEYENLLHFHPNASSSGKLENVHVPHDKVVINFDTKMLQAEDKINVANK